MARITLGRLAERNISHVAYICRNSVARASERWWLAATDSQSGIDVVGASGSASRAYAPGDFGGADAGAPIPWRAAAAASSARDEVPSFVKTCAR